MEKITDENLYLIKKNEKIENHIFYKYLDNRYKERFSFLVLENREFWFSLGFDKNGNLNLSGNCYTWSNAFNFLDIPIKEVYKILSLFNPELTQDLTEKIIKKLWLNQNKLFFCKEDYRFRAKEEEKKKFKTLSWHYFPEENPNQCDELNFSFDLEQDLKKLGANQ